jgi:hypothetical protein
MEFVLLLSFYLLRKVLLKTFWEIKRLESTCPDSIPLAPSLEVMAEKF